jgi:nicotinamidase/pyrazinamidase
MRALLLIGMQVDLLPGGPAEVLDSKALVPIVNGLMADYNLVVAANFALPADHVMFAANHLWRKPGQAIQANGRPLRLHHLHCVAGSFGAEPVPGLRIEKIAFNALMGTERDAAPHSAFFDEGKKRDTGLAAFLASQNVSEIHLAGMPQDTVQYSAQDAAGLGFIAKILRSATSNQPTATAHD